MESEQNKLEKYVLPSIEDLTSEKALKEMGKLNQLNILLNQEPPQKWLKAHPFANRIIKDDDGQKQTVPMLYLPIEKVEYLLTRIFIEWRPEILKVQLIANAVVVTVRVHYKNPLNGEMKWIDGVGAAPLSTKAKAGAIEFNEMVTSAVQTATPAAKSYAIKDAVEPLGKLFGKDLNRADAIGYDNIINSYPQSSLYFAKSKLTSLQAQCQDDDLNSKVAAEIMEAETKGTDNLEFYERMAKYYERPNK